MAVPIIPRVERGRLYFQIADVLFLPSLRPLAPGALPKLTGSIAERHELRTQSPLRRCDDCELNLGRAVLRALGSCPRWGKPRHGVETHCPAFVAKGGAR